MSKNVLSKNIKNFDSLILEQLKVRGPDGTNLVSDTSTNIQYGFTRLAIRAIDNGNQPYQNERFISAFNGELYNSDFLVSKIKEKFPTETIPDGDMQLLGLWLYLFGPEAISKTVGMFAGYITIGSKIFAFRDRVGEKPLYYGYFDDIFFISSVLPNTIYNKIALKENTILSGLSEYKISDSIYMLPPGSYIEVEQSDIIKQNAIKTHTYWEWPKRKHFISGDNFKNFKELAFESIRSQLVSDVGVSVLLSGGIDSGIVAAVARQEVGPTLQAFTLSFKGSEYDEAKSAIITSKHLKLKHEIIDVTYEDLALNVQSTLEAMDIPIFDTGALSLFTLSKEVSKFYKVSLTGDGGDELFRGYSLFDHILLLNLLIMLPMKTPISLFLKIINKYFSSTEDYLGIELKAKRALSVTSNKKLSPFLGAIGPIGGTDLFELISKKFVHQSGNDRKIITRSALEQYYVNEILPKIYLVKSDRMSMVHGLELRAPLLDYRVIESAFDLAEININFKKRKAHLKNIGKELLPKQILNAKKHGFSLPFHKVVKYLDMPQWKSYQSDEELAEFVKIWLSAKNGIESAAIPAWNLLVKEHFFNKSNQGFA